MDIYKTKPAPWQATNCSMASLDRSLQHGHLIISGLLRLRWIGPGCRGAAGAWVDVETVGNRTLQW